MSLPEFEAVTPHLHMKGKAKTIRDLLTLDLHRCSKLVVAMKMSHRRCHGDLVACAFVDLDIVSFLMEEAPLFLLHLCEFEDRFFIL